MSNLKPLPPMPSSSTRRPRSADAPPCMCGCGMQPVGANSRFVMGHDGRFHGFVRRVESGLWSLADLADFVDGQQHIVAAVEAKVEQRKAEADKADDA